jgi:hypothetical protein
MPTSPGVNFDRHPTDADSLGRMKNEVSYARRPSRRQII